MAQTAGATNYVLSSIVGEGVQGNLVTSTQQFDEGTGVPYAFTPVPGYSSALVVIDGVVAPASGTITMSANHWIWAFGNPAEGTQFSGMMTVPADFTKIPYPEFYQQRPAFDFTVADPYCAITSDVIAYPSSYLGSFPMPSVQGAPLPPTVRRGANLKDYWAYGFGNPSTNEGCSGDMHEAFIATLQRLKKLGIDHVGVYRAAAVIDTNANQLQFLNAAAWSISDSEMAWIVAQVHTFGLKVYEYRQISPEDTNNVPLPMPPTEEWASKYLDAYIEYIVDRATVAQQLGVDAFMLDWDAYWFDWTPYKDLFISKMTEAAQQVRGVYTGKILYGWVALEMSGNPTLLSNIDELIFSVNPIISAAENTNLTVPILKQKYLDLITAMADALGPNRKPIGWWVFIQSHRNFLTSGLPFSGWVEDGFCVDGCVQQSIEIDFSVQAIAYEAFLEAIAEQTDFTTASVEAIVYWYVDVMLPKTSFPNLSQSWRNKPAESILYQWFKRFAAADFDGNGTSNIGVYRDGGWYLDLDGKNQWDGCGVDGCYGFGLAGDQAVVGDWTGSGQAKLGIFRDGGWYLDLNGNYQWDGCGVDGCYVFGSAGDQAVAGDWTGSGQAMLGVYRDGGWYLDLNGNNQWDGCGVDGCYVFGSAGDQAVVGDWTGSGRAMLGVYRNGGWYLDLNGNNQWDGCGVDGCYVFGVSGDQAVVGDWTGSGQAKLGIFRDGGWYMDLDGNGQWDGCGVDGCYVFGLAGDTPAN